MVIIRTIVCFFTAFIAFSKISLCQEYRPSIDVRVPFVSAITTINGKPTLYYELYLTNFSTDSIILKTVEVFGSSDTIPVASFNQDELAARSAGIGVAKKGTENMLAPGHSCIVYLELNLLREKFPTQLSHKIIIDILKKDGRKEFAVQGIPIQPPQKSPVILGPPLNGGPWAAVYNPLWERGHRRVIYTVDGKARIPGRYAIDFIKLDSQGRYARGDQEMVKNWYGYAANVLSVANGTILAALDTFPESATLSGLPSCTPDKATGNYIALDIGNGNIAFYEHLRPGSIRVRPGQQVKKGEIIAALGFTGQTTGPHLHFHVADRNSPLGAEGVAFGFEQFTVLGAYIDLEKFGKERWTDTKDAPVSPSKEHPAPNSVIMF
jgi:murein DD-endopeptidase